MVGHVVRGRNVAARIWGMKGAWPLKVWAACGSEVSSECTSCRRNYDSLEIRPSNAFSSALSTAMIANLERARKLHI